VINLEYYKESLVLTLEISRLRRCR